MIDWETVKRDGWQLKHAGQPRVLAIDGGGTRGVFAARYLSLLEKHTGHQVNEIFDLVVGTSTGGIIALALGAGIAAEALVDLYREHARAIFTPSPLARKLAVIPFLGRVVGQMGLFGPRYGGTELTRLLKETFGTLRMKDARTMLCIPAVEHYRASPTVFKTPHHATLFRDAECYMWDVALATSAAPTYFPPYVKGLECKIDGGLWANSPVLVGVAEAVKNRFDVRAIHLLSLGTGETAFDGSDQAAKVGGLLSYLFGGLPEMILSLQMQSAQNIAKYLLGDNLVRVTFSPSRKLPLDAVSKDDIDMMVKEADMEFNRSFRDRQNVKSHFCPSL